jgi:hypothetical protein
MGQSFLTDLFTVCFAFGAATTVLNFVFGFGRHGGPLHSPDGGHVGHLGHLGHGGHPGSLGHDSTTSEISPLNLTSILAFLTVFGAVGLVAQDGLGALLALVVATLSGLVAGWIAFVFVVQFLIRGQTYLENDASTGTVATVSAAIGKGHVGEIKYTRHNVRRSDGARSVDGQSIAVGEEVVILAIDGGIATVQRWQEFIDSSPGSPVATNIERIGRPIDPADPRKEGDP